MVILWGEGEGAQDVQICDLIHKSVNWQRPLVLPAWWPPTIWIFYFIIKIELGIPRAGHHAESTRLSDLWLYWVTGLLTGTVLWCSLLDGHPTMWILYLIFVFLNSYDNLNYSVMNPRAGHPAESTRFSDLWLYWVTGLLTGTVPWFSLLDDHPMKWMTY
jgi:hypothetical protein